MARENTAEQSTTGLLDTNDLAERLKTGDSAPSPRTIERWRSTGQGPDFIKLGRRVAYRPSAVERWLDQRTRSHTSKETD
jgi:predicted DNA-binding transcriptional regulator AlpA